jgi:hypothetical protein
LAKKGVRTKRWYLYHKENENGIVERFCTGCEKWMEENTENFYLMNKSNPEKGYSSQCKSCMSKSAFAREKKNPFKRKISSRKWNNKPETRELMNKLNKERREEGKTLEWARNNKDIVNKHSRDRREKKEHRITAKEWEDCKHYFANRCAYCGLDIEDHWIKRKGKMINVDLHKEHVIDQGRNDLKNTVPSCQSCNSSKHTSSLNNWYNENNPNYTYERYLKICKWLKEDYKNYIKKKKPKQKYVRKAS